MSSKKIKIVIFDRSIVELKQNLNISKYVVCNFNLLPTIDIFLSLRHHRYSDLNNSEFR